MNKSFPILLAVGFALFSCAKLSPQAVQGGQDSDEDNMDYIMAYGPDAPLKTVVNNGTKVLWTDADRIGMFADNSSKAEYVTSLESPSASAAFGRTSDVKPSQVGGRYYAVYPAQAVLSWAKKTDIEAQDKPFCAVSIPGAQTAVKGSWDRKAALLAASSAAKSFSFRHVMSYLCFEVTDNTGDFVSVELSSVNEEKLSDPNAALKVTPSGSFEVTVSEDAGHYVTLAHPEEGTAFGKGIYYIAFLPGNFTGGLSLGFINAEGKRAVKSIDPLTLAPGQVLEYGEVKDMEFVKYVAPLKLCDVYQEDSKNQGVVFWIDPSDPFKGKIVSPGSKSKLAWAVSGSDGPVGCGSDLNQDSATNFNKIITSPGYAADKYPAAGYCQSLGSGWRLPSIEEAQILFNSYYGKAYDTALVAGADKGGTDYRSEEAEKAAKQKFDKALSEVLEGDTIDGLDPDALGTIYWLDEETKASGSTAGKNAFTVRVGMYYYKNWPKTNEYYARCIRDVEAK